MGLLGKLLAVLNILAALGFVYLAAADYALRRSWSYAVTRYDLKLDGLPLDDEERDPLDGQKRVVQIGEHILQAASEGGGVPGVATQQAELKRVHDQLLGEIQGKDGEEAKRKQLAAVLIPLAVTGPERDALAQQIATAKWDDLMGPEGPFERAFNQILARKDQQDRREAFAHLLFNLGAHFLFNPPQPDEAAFTAWQQRVVAVIGLKAYTAEVNRQATALREMTGRVQSALVQDRSDFETQHNKMVGALRVLAEQIDDAQADLKHQLAIQQAHETLVTKRKEERDRLKGVLENARAATKEALLKQADEEKRLFAAQGDLADGQLVNERLERKIRELENLEP